MEQPLLYVATPTVCTKPGEWLQFPPRCSHQVTCASGDYTFRFLNVRKQRQRFILCVCLNTLLHCFVYFNTIVQVLVH